MKKLALHWKIIIGMVLGVVYGLIASKMGWVDVTNNWIKPWGVIFVAKPQPSIPELFIFFEKCGITYFFV